MRHHENWQKRKCKVCRYSFTSYITATYSNIFSLGFSVISKIFVSDLSMCLFAGKDIAQKLLLF